MRGFEFDDNMLDGMSGLYGNMLLYGMSGHFRCFVAPFCCRL